MTGATPIYTTGSLPVTADHEPGVVTLEVGRGTRMAFDPKDAAELGHQLLEQAQNAIHAERVGRRKPV